LIKKYGDSKISLEAIEKTINRLPSLKKIESIKEDFAIMDKNIK
jgi:hypothetical protein